MQDDKTPDTEENWDDYAKSKSRLKNEMTELQKLGIAIAELPDKKRSQFKMGEELLFAIEEYRRIGHKNARKRQAQYIGKLMRRDGADELKDQWAALDEEHHRKTRQLHLIEQWRDRLINDGQTALNAFLDSYRETDRQQLRQLLAAIDALQKKNKPTTAKTRKLFTFVQAAINHTAE